MHLPQSHIRALTHAVNTVYIQGTSLSSVEKFPLVLSASSTWMTFLGITVTPTLPTSLLCHVKGIPPFSPAFPELSLSFILCTNISMCTLDQQIHLEAYFKGPCLLGLHSGRMGKKT